VGILAVWMRFLQNTSRNTSTLKVVLQ
jgi:hypothetical protein